MKKFSSLGLIVLALFLASTQLSAQNVYTQRFLDLRAKMNDPNNGYFSKDGVPYHSVETLMAEAPDHGHETTSEAYSYWIWMEAMYGGISGDWAPLNNAWSVMEAKAIPTSAQQPTTSSYDPSKPATYAGEHPLPDLYPSILESTVPVGEDPVSPDLTATYGSDIYAMHWLFDCDNFYGYGNQGDGVSTPSYINTFQRGEQESVWETVPHPSWEDFSWGAKEKGGFLNLFVDDPKPTKQWRYTNAPDADTRAVQAMYWATQFAKEQGKDPKAILPLDKASKMGDFMRLAMFDKYFKPMGVQDKMGPGGTGYQSAHYLMSWYFAWGGPLEAQGWAWRIGSSHHHFGYQNPMAAYALSQVDELKPISTNGVRDWGLSLDRQIEFYTWLQSAEGAIAGGATNSLNGDYSAYPAGTATFYDMAYQEHPVYHDPGSNQWIGMQAWSMERIAELYYITNDPRTKKLLDNWVAWLKSEIHLLDDGGFEIPATLKWTGQPETWNPASPKTNSNLHVSVSEYGQDLGIAACLAKALIYYAAGTQAHATLDDDARELAKQILDRMWDKYYEPNGLGVAAEESRGDFSRFFEQEVFVPAGYSGTMANGDVIEPGVKFIDIRSEYKKDKDFPKLEAAYQAGEPYKAKFHRYWAQSDIALANAEYGRLFGEVNGVASVAVSPTTASVVIGATTTLTATVMPFNAANKKVSWSTSNAAVATVDATGLVTGVSEGSATITATTEDGGFTASAVVEVTSVPHYTLAVSAIGAGSVTVSPVSVNYVEGDLVTLTATPDANYEFTGWSGDLTGSTNPVTITMNANKVIKATFKEIPAGCATPGVISLPHIENGIGEYCWVTTGTVTYINSWNMDLVEINGQNFTNKWANQMPAKIDGQYKIRYVASMSSAHFEINGSGGTTDPTYSLTSNVVGSGTITPASGTYTSGTVVNLVATPAAGWEFAGWSGAATGSNTSTSITMSGDKLVTATFTEVSTPEKYTLSVVTVGNGSVTVSPLLAEYEAGATVTLTATADAENTFSGWSGNASGTSASVSVTMTGNKTVTATFATVVEPTTYSLSVNTIGSGSVTVSPLLSEYEAGSSVSLTAVADAGYVFDFWSGDISGTSSNASLTMNADKVVTANFKEEIIVVEPCNSPLTVSLPLTQNGIGEFCWVTSDDISFINSWNTDLVVINGVTITNSYLGNMPAKIDGKYYIQYKASVAWSHLEVNGASKKIGAITKATTTVYPNPFTEYVNLKIAAPEDVVGILVIDKLGRVIQQLNVANMSDQITLGQGLEKGIYIIQVQYKQGTDNLIINKQ